MSDATASSPATTEAGTQTPSPAPETTATNAEPTSAQNAGDAQGRDAKSLLDVQPEALPFDAEKLTLGDGFEKSEHFKDFVALATEEKLSQGASQKLIDLYAKAAKLSAEASQSAWREQNDKWQQEVKSDPEVGGSKLANVLQTVSRVMDNPDLTDPQFREALSFTGAGNHPAIVRTLARWARALSEGSAIAGSPPGTNGQRPSIADRLYPGGPRTSIHRME